MNKAIIGVFNDSMSASRAINDLKAYGFGGESIGEVLREDVMRGQRLPGPRLLPGMEIIKGLILGAIVGGILGGAANWFLGTTLAWPSLGLTDPLYATIITVGAVGALAGLVQGIAAMAPMARARRAMLMRNHGDAMVTVDTDETHAARAADIMRASGAIDVRRGACSVADEFRTTETVQPEAYGTAPLVQREQVEAPAESRETTEAPPASGGTVG